MNDSYNSNLTLLCSVGLRAIVEGICKDKSISGKNLDTKISGLASKGFITNDQAEILHELRFLGNDIAHELIQPSTEELSVAIDIVELVIDNIYNLKSKAIHLKESRESMREKK